MKQQRVPFLKSSPLLKSIFGMVVIALLLLVLGSLLGSINLNPQTTSSLQRLLQDSDIQRNNSTPTASSFYLPLISQNPGTVDTDIRPNDIIQQSSIVIRADKEWETYVDPFYGYSVQYPRGWYLRPTPSGTAWRGGVAYLTTFDPTVDDSKERRDQLVADGYIKIDIGVSMTPKLPDESLEDWLARREDPTVVRGASTMERRTVNGSSEPAIVKVFAPDTHNSLSTQVVYVPKGDKVYYISVFELPFHSQYYDFIDRILDSFSLESGL